MAEQDFDQKGHQGRLMNMGEILRFAKDHNIYPTLLAKDEVQTLVRIINLRRKKTTDV